MARARVSSLMNSFGQKLQHSAPPSSSPSPQPPEKIPPDAVAASSQQFTPDQYGPAPVTPPRGRNDKERTERSRSRPGSMIFPLPAMDMGGDTIPELVPIFRFLNSHANKLYQEGYFLKLNDLDISGRPNTDRNWSECFAQLVGTVLTLWDATALDSAGQDADVPPNFINLADASIKMIETLPTSNKDIQPLNNVLSISTAGKNRYLLHFNSFHSLTQWTAGIRLSMFEHTSLQELYTGSLIAGKGKTLNNIRNTMERSKFAHEDWARVRFGAGTPWRRCWCVIEPPNEKDYQKELKSKKRSAYERPVAPKGHIKFYDTKKTKKAIPIATITDGYSAYAIYPQSKPLIDQSTLVKVEGQITIHSTPESTTEGFIFVMPEAHAAVSGFEIMLRWLFPVYDGFGLYGRPLRLIADTLDSRGLMFAMPKDRRYGYLDIQDVASLVCKDGSQTWSEQDWRRQLKNVTATRLSSMPLRAVSRQGTKSGSRNSLPAGTNLQLEDGASVYSSPSQKHKHNLSTDGGLGSPQKPRGNHPAGSLNSATYHARSASDTLAFANSPRKRNNEQYTPSRLSMDKEAEEEYEISPLPHVQSASVRKNHPGPIELPKRSTSLADDFQQSNLQDSAEVGSELRPKPPPTPVAAPPAFLHSPGERPSVRPNASPELRRENSRMSIATLSQLVDAGRQGQNQADGGATAGAAAAWKNESSRKQELAFPMVLESNSRKESPADTKLPRKGLAIGLTSQQSPYQRSEESLPSNGDKPISRKPVRSAPGGDSSEAVGKEAVDGYTKIKIANNPFGASQEAGKPTAHGKGSNTPISGRPDERQANGNPASVESHVLPLSGEAQDKRSRGAARYRVGGAIRNSGGSPAGEQSRTPVESVTPKDEKRMSTGANFGTAADPQARSKSQPPNPDRMLAWQPGAVSMGSGRKSPGPRITPEEYVRQRASPNQAISPNYHKNRSSGHLPVDRPASGDWSKRRESGSRPASGDIGALFNRQPEYRGTQMSAREQEQLAKMTNSPLIQMNGRQGTTSPSAGLVGAIGAREQEKKQARQGINSQAVQQVVAQRQQQAQQQYERYQQQLVQQQTAQQKGVWQPPVLSPQAQAYQAQMGAGFFAQPSPQSRSQPNTPGGWYTPMASPQWPNTQNQTYSGMMTPQQQLQQPQQQHMMGGPTGRAAQSGQAYGGERQKPARNASSGQQ